MGEIINFSGVQGESKPTGRPFPDPDNPVTVEIDPRELGQSFLRAGFMSGDPQIEGMGMNILVGQYGQEKAQQIRDAARTRFDLYQRNSPTSTGQSKGPHLKLVK